MKRFFGAEFQRNLWLEFSPLRLAVMPVLLGLTLTIVADFYSRQHLNASESLFTACLFL
jgi:hypothetical protein